MIEQTIARSTARRIYDRLGSDLDRNERFEGQAKALAIDLLRVAPGQRLLHLGVGSGIEHALLAAAVGPTGLLIGCDLSRGMLELTRQRTATPLCQADVARLPFQPQRFDRVFSAYLLDLIPLAEIPLVLSTLRRLLRPDGRLVLVSLTDGVDRPSRLFVASWKLVYRLSPQRLGGCRPLQLAALLGQAGFAVERQVVVQRGFPSEVLVGIPATTPSACYS